MKTFDITNNKEICNQIENIFKKILNENQKLSEKECNDFTETAYNDIMVPMFDCIELYTQNDIINKIKEIKEKYDKKCKGDLKTDIWKQFEMNKLDKELRHFNTLKVLTDRMGKYEQQAINQKTQYDKLMSEYKEQQVELFNQRKLVDELEQIHEINLEKQKEYYMSLLDAEKTCNKLQDKNITELMKTFQVSQNQISQQIMNMEQNNYKDIMTMMMLINSAFHSFQKQLGGDDDEKSSISNINCPYNEFDAIFNENGYFSISSDKKSALFAKKSNVKQQYDYEYFPCCRISRRIDTYDTLSQIIKFKMSESGWFGIGNNNLQPHGFPGYTKNGWMIRINDGASWYNNIGDCVGRNPIGDLTKKIITITYTPNTKKLTVVIPNGEMYVYHHKDMPPSNGCYFVFSMNCGKVQLFD
eukprot:110981_1